MADAPVECGVRPTATAKFGKSARVRCDLRRNRPPFLGHCNELNHTDVSLLLNKNAVLKFDLLHGTFAIQFGNFLTRPRISQTTN